MNDFFSNTNFEGNANQAQGQGEGDRPISGNNNVHVSLSQVVHLTRREDGLVVHRQKVHSITVIGVVINVEEATTKNVYLIDDYTNGGPVDVQLWRNESDGVNVFTPPPPVMEHTYVRVIGQARFDERKPFIVAFKIEPITNPNEIGLHFLEVISDSLILEKRKNHTLNMMKSSGNTSHMDTTNAFSDQNSTAVMSGFNEVQRAVLDVLNKYGRESTYGLKRFEIHNFMTGTNKNLINEAITFLVNEGHIFSTADDDTFQSTDF